LHVGSASGTYGEGYTIELGVLQIEEEEFTAGRRGRIHRRVAEDAESSRAILAFIVNGASYLLALRMQSRRKHCVRWHVQKALKARITTTR